MSRNLQSILLGLAIAAAALASSCGGSSVQLDSAEQAQGTDTAALPQHLDSAEPLMAPDKGAASLGDWLGDLGFDFNPDIDFEAWWESLHVPVVSGDNEIPLDKYLAKSGNTETAQVIVGIQEGPMGLPEAVLGPGLQLKSSAGEMAYAEFGLSGIPDGQDVVHVHFKGQGAEIAEHSHGLYIGLSNYAHGTYSWYGPYDLFAGEWNVGVNIEDASSTGHAYLAFAVYDGDELDLSGLDVTVGNRLIIEIPDLELPDLQVLEH